jgi:glutamine synthetase
MATTDMSCNALVDALKKPRAQFTKEDIKSYIRKNGIRHVNFMYPGGDGRLKTLNFVINDAEYLDEILTCGERVDGSSLFSYIEASSSDLYVVPRYSTAFIDPFASLPTLCLLCSFFNKDGEPLESSPEYTLQKACAAFKKETGMDLEAMGELEYYVIAPDPTTFPAVDQRGYHESAPFAKFNEFRQKCMLYIAQAGGQIKYGHSEVGNFSADGKDYEQNEIEFLPVNIEQAADQLVVAKWAMRQIAYKYGVDLTFAPKITPGKAGSGMHVHCKFSKDGKSCMVEGGELTDICKKAIAGFMLAGTSLPAFGNPHPLSFMRLVPHQEAPTSLCWSFSNRSALVRVPLGWTGKGDMSADCNPLETPSDKDFSQKQTFEWRASDGFADTYLLMAALCCAARHGFEMPDALEVAEKTYVGLGVNIHDASNKAVQEALEQLPACCVEASAELAKHREIYTSKGVFSDSIVDFYVDYLKSFDDANLRAKLSNDLPALLALVQENIDRG